MDQRWPARGVGQRQSVGRRTARWALGIFGLITALAVASSACGSGDRPELVASDGGAGADGLAGAAAQVLTVDDDEDEAGVVDDEPVPSQRGSSARASVAADPSGPTVDVPLIAFDTDMGPDIDDALALAMLHAYQDRGEAEIAAVTLSRNSVTGARFVDALNTSFGHPDLPIGIDRASSVTLTDEASFVTLADRWPNDVAAGASAGQGAEIADGVTLLRRFLARAVEEEREAVLVQVGFSGNTAALLDSGPDDISPLTGPELVEQSGALLSIMAGSIPGDRVEFNVANDVESARRVLTGWPGDLVLSPWELGADVRYPYAAVRDRLAGDGSDLLRVAYEFRDYPWHVDAPPYYDMRAWDLTSVMHGVEREAGWFPVSSWGRVTIDERGRTGFAAGEGRHRYLDRSAMSGDDITRAQQQMIDLVSSARP